MTDTDYNYDDGDAVKLNDSDSSKNDPTSLQGYDIHIQKDASWPGLAGKSGEMRMDTEGVDAVISWLTQQASQMASLTDDMATTSSANFGPEAWLEAIQLREASRQVSKTVTRYSTDLIANLKNASDALHRAKAHVTGADDAGAQSADNVTANIGGTAPTSGTTGYYGS